MPGATVVLAVGGFACTSLSTSVIPSNDGNSGVFFVAATVVSVVISKGFVPFGIVGTTTFVSLIGVSIIRTPGSADFVGLCPPISFGDSSPVFTIAFLDVCAFMSAIADDRSYSRVSRLESF